MGKSLIIKGADFSQVAVNSNILVSDTQTSLGTDQYYGMHGTIATAEGIEGVQKIQIPDGIAFIRPSESLSGLEPASINCFDNYGVHLGLVGNEQIGGSKPIGTTGWYELINGTASFSYIYKNSYGTNDYNMGLNITWIGE